MMRSVAKLLKKRRPDCVQSMASLITRERAVDDGNELPSPSVLNAAVNDPWWSKGSKTVLSLVKASARISSSKVGRKA